MVYEKYYGKPLTVHVRIQWHKNILNSICISNVTYQLLLVLLKLLCCVRYVPYVYLM